MNENITNTIYLAGVFLVLFASAEILYHKFNVKAEITRKIVHVSTGLLTMLFPPLIENHWLVLLLCSSFFIILMLSIALKLLPSINAVDRKTRGSILYPVIVYGCFLLYGHYGQLMIYYIPILILAISDPIAALVGKNWPKWKYKTFGQTKTLSGSAGFLISSLIICLSLFMGLESIPFNKAIAISFGVAIVTTIAEAVSHRGYDNLTIPVGALCVLIFFNYYYNLV
jgi:dolichol kinase